MTTLYAILSVLAEGSYTILLQNTKGYNDFQIFPNLEEHFFVLYTPKEERHVIPYDVNERDIQATYAILDIVRDTLGDPRANVVGLPGIITVLLKLPVPTK